MSIPGPGFGAWALALLVFAAASAIVGGAVRTAALRWVRSWRSLGPVERLVLDLYLGGAVVYAVALPPLGLFGVATFPVLLALAVAYLLVRAYRLGRRASGEAVVAAARRYLSPGPTIALLAAGALGVFELALAIGVPTGNTYDASQLATYTALLLTQHSVPTSLAGVGLSIPVAYPQGGSVWMGTAQLLFALPPARTAVLVTPLFLALAPLGAYTLGDRWMGGEHAGATLAVAFAVLTTWTRVQVSGSYDFVLAFPLTLLLIALSRAWCGPDPLTWKDAAAFGLVAGYAAALSPVGIGWWFLALPFVAGAVAAGRWFGDVRRWFGRYVLALAMAAVPIAPSLGTVASGVGHLGFAGEEPVVGRLAPVGLTGSQIAGYVDPFVFGPSNQWLSPFPVVRDEIAILLVVGLLLLALRPSYAGDWSPFAGLAFGGVVSAAAWFGVEWLAGQGVSPFRGIAPITNGAELSEMLFTVYALVAMVPLLVLVDRWARARPVEAARSRRWSLPAGGPPSATVAIAVVGLLLAPGVAASATEMPNDLATLYRSFGNVSADDFALFAWASRHLPDGARVLVAPGSAAQFLTAYDPSL
ncbi:MAG TPA: hypothetical protein VGP88_05685, partial [Thermoplasmata archaeon]|nr:hypothetical protein [Thermoplasmata archaeon]